MTPQEIHTRLEAMESRIADAGYICHGAKFAIKFLAGGKYNCWLEFRAGENSKTENEYFHADDPGTALDAADDFIRNMRSVDEAKKEAFLHALGRVIDQGREADVDVDFLNPLTETMKRLSKNIITHTPLRVVGDGEVPFQENTQ